MVLNNPLFVARNSRSGFQINQSLRFDGGSRFSFTPSSTGNRRKFTLSLWIKRWRTGVTEERLFTAATLSGSEPRTEFGFTSGGNIDRIISGFNPTGSTWYTSTTEARYRDPAAWMHIVYTVDTEQATDSNRAKVYINGSYVGVWSSTSYVPQNSDLPFNNSGSLHYLGDYAGAGASGQNRIHSYIAEVHYLDGTYVSDASDFGETNTDGVWVPKKVSGVTYGTNGFYLDFSNSSNLGEDKSGNGNDLTPSGFTTSGTGTDVMSDTPTTNYCTWNPLGPVTNSAGNNSTFSNGNLTGTTSNSATTGGLGTIGVSSGKWYFEVTCGAFTGGTGLEIGVAKENLQSTISSSEGGGTSADGYFYINDGRKVNNNSPSSYGASYTNGDVISVLLDLDAGSVTFHKNGTSQGTAYTGLSGVYHPAFSDYNDIGTSSCTLNCGQRAFSYTLPSGYSALNTSNLPAPEIADGSDYFQTVTYTGTGATRDITVADNSSNAWQPDFVWIKNRDISDHHALFDSVRGVLKYMSSNRINEEASLSNSLTAFNTDGFELGSANLINYSSQAYVAWNWLAGNGTSSNTSGSITSTVSVNQTAGFSIVTYTGTGSAATIGHGLGVAPKMIIAKQRDVASNEWAVYHASLGSSYFLKLNTTDSKISNSGVWNNNPTSTVFHVGTGNVANYSGANHVAYCFAEVEGYSKIGQYHGNSSNDGVFVYTGFKPAFILVKGDLGQDWFIADSVRDPYNVSLRWLRPNLTDVEINDPASGGSSYDILSNGFKFYTNTYGWNRDYDYWYIAFASNPFGGSGVSPATAR